MTSLMCNELLPNSLTLFMDAVSKEAWSLGQGPCLGCCVKFKACEQVSMAQQYNLTLTGHPDLRHWLRQHVMDQHEAPGEHDTYVSSGTNHALEVCFALFLTWTSLAAAAAKPQALLQGYSRGIGFGSSTNLHASSLDASPCTPG